jgi:serum response factor
MDTSAGAGRDSRFNLGYNMSLLSGETSPEMYGTRPSTSLNSGMSRSGMGMSGACAPGMQRGLKRTSSDVCFVDQDGSGRTAMGLSGDCGADMLDDSYSPAPQKSTPPPNGKKTKGRVKIKMEYIDNKLRRYTTFSKRKTGIMKKVRRPSAGVGPWCRCFGGSLECSVVVHVLSCTAAAGACAAGASGLQAPSRPVPSRRAVLRAPISDRSWCYSILVMVQ